MATAKKTAKKKKSAPAKKKAAAPKKKVAVKKAAPKPQLTAIPRIDWAEVFHPLQDRLVVIEAKKETVSSGGLILPDSVETEGPLRGTVVAVGTGKRMKRGQIRPLDVQVGDTVLISKFAGTKVTVERQDAIIVREEDVLGIES